MRGHGRRRGGARSPVSTKLPTQQKKPDRKALNGKVPTKRAYTNCTRAVSSAHAEKQSSTCGRAGRSIGAARRAAQRTPLSESSRRLTLSFMGVLSYSWTNDAKMLLIEGSFDCRGANFPCVLLMPAMESAFGIFMQ